MCAPAAPAIALGVAQAGVGIMGATAQHNAQVAQVRQQNEASARQYKYQLKMRERSWERDREVWDNQIENYQDQVAENNMAAQNAYSSEQRRLNEIYRNAAFDRQKRTIDLVSELGRNTAARGVIGRSADRIDRGSLADFGRTQAALSESLVSANQSYTQRSGLIRDQLAIANKQAYQPVSIAPQVDIAPPKPVMQTGPSGLSLAAGVLGAGLSGFNTYNTLKPPSTD